MGPHYSHSSRENATPSSGTSLLASCKGIPAPLPGLIRPLSSPLPLSRFRDWKKKSMPFGGVVQTSSAKGITAFQLVIKLRTDFLLLSLPPGPFCTCQYTRGIVFKFAQFAPGACSQIFNLLNIVEHFAGWKFCSRGWSIPMKSLVHTEELCSRSLPQERAPGAKSFVCIDLF